MLYELAGLLYEVFCYIFSQAEWQYRSGQWLEMCVQQADLIADCAGNLISAWKTGCVMWVLNKPHRDLHQRPAALRPAARRVQAEQATEEESPVDILHSAEK